MELHELRSFIMLTEVLHFGRAAAALNVSQPALSKQIKKIEAEVGAPLFHRGAGGTALSPTGAVLAADARALLAQADLVRVRAQQAGRGEVGTLNVGFGIYTYELVPRVIARFRRAHPHIFVSLRDMSTAGQIDFLHNRTLDIGFMRYPAPNEFASRLIGRDRLVLALPKAYAAQRKSKSLAALAQTPFVQMERRRSIPFFDQVMSLCSAYNFTPKIEQEAAEFSTVLALVASGAGVSMVPRTARQDIKGVAYREITHPAAEWELGAVWRKGEPNPVIENFMSCLDAELTLSGGGKV